MRFVRRFLSALLLLKIIVSMKRFMGFFGGNAEKMYKFTGVLFKSV